MDKVTGNFGRIRIDWELLKQVLNMPEDTKISNHIWHPRHLELVVQHPDLTEVPLDEPVPFYELVMTRHEEWYEWKRLSRKDYR